MNPLYLVGALLGLYGLTRLASSSAKSVSATQHKLLTVNRKFIQAAPNVVWDGPTTISQLGAAFAVLQLTGSADAIANATNVLAHAKAVQAQGGFRDQSVNAQINALIGNLSSALGSAGGGGGASGTKSAADLIKQGQAIVSSFPADGSDASAYIAWTASTALQVPGLISDIQNVISQIQSGNAAGDIGMLTTLVTQLGPLVAKAASAAASASTNSSSSSDTSSSASDGTTTA